jgi:integrase
MNKPFHSSFAVYLHGYVKLRQQLGVKYLQQSRLLYHFDTFVHAQGYTGSLTQELALAYAMAAPCQTKGEQARRYAVIRHFAEYLTAFDPHTAMLDPHAIYQRRERYAPYIYTADDLARLLRAATSVFKSPLRKQSFITLVGLAVSTGMRVGELIRLDCADVDWGSGTLLIRKTKFGKDRLVPLHPTTLTALRVYADLRQSIVPPPATPAFFLTSHGIRYSYAAILAGFRAMLTHGDLWQAAGKRPRFHDLRHTFAVRRLETWYQEGQDVQALLPWLATYMGHVQYTCTAYYITATPQLMALAAARADTAWLAHAETEAPE